MRRGSMEGEASAFSFCQLWAMPERDFLSKPASLNGSQIDAAVLLLIRALARHGLGEGQKQGHRCEAD